MPSALIVQSRNSEAWSPASEAAVDPSTDGETSIPGSHSAAPDETVRTFSTPVTLPFGLLFNARTREAVRSLPPDALGFRHLSGPVRGLAERITVVPVGHERSRVTYQSSLPLRDPC